MKNLVNQNVWDASYKDYKFEFNGRVPLQNILVKYVEKESSCLEIGCFPGNFLRFLHWNKKAIVSGVDRTSELPKLEESFRREGIDYEYLINADVVSLEPPKQFDVVMSFGFIEHFDDLHTILLTHDKFLKSNGRMILALPNFTRLQFFFRKYLRSMTLPGHNFEVMDPVLISEKLTAFGYEIIDRGYSGTVEYWCEKDKVPYGFKIANLGLSFVTRVIDKFVNLPNRYSSPYIYVIAKK